MNIPNILTGMRLLMIPFFGYFIWIEEYVIGAILFLMAGFTDFLDGYIARKFKLVTNFGKVADPIADKLMQVTALALLAYRGRIPVLILLILATKEILMIIGGVVLYKKGEIVVPANWYGKIGTVLIYLAIVLSMFRVPYSDIVVYVALLFAIFAFIMYGFNYMKVSREKASEAVGK